MLDGPGYLKDRKLIAPRPKPQLPQISTQEPENNLGEVMPLHFLFHATYPPVSWAAWSSDPENTLQLFIWNKRHSLFIVFSADVFSTGPDRVHGTRSLLQLLLFLCQLPLPPASHLQLPVARNCYYLLSFLKRKSISS